MGVGRREHRESRNKGADCPDKALASMSADCLQANEQKMFDQKIIVACERAFILLKL